MSSSTYVDVNVELTVGLDAYTAVDVVGGLLTFRVPGTAGGGILNGISLLDEDDQSEGYTVYLHDELPSTIADDAAYAPTIADLRKQFAVVTIVTGDYTSINSLGYVHKTDLNYVFNTDASNGNIYVYLAAIATPDYTNADTLYLRLHILTEQ